MIIQMKLEIGESITMFFFVRMQEKIFKYSFKNLKES